MIQIKELLVIKIPRARIIALFKLSIRIWLKFLKINNTNVDNTCYYIYFHNRTSVKHLIWFLTSINIMSTAHRKNILRSKACNNRAFRHAITSEFYSSSFYSKKKQVFLISYQEQNKREYYLQHSRIVIILRNICDEYMFSIDSDVNKFRNWI